MDYTKTPTAEARDLFGQTSVQKHRTERQVCSCKHDACQQRIELQHQSRVSIVSQKGVLCCGGERQRTEHGSRALSLSLSLEAEWL